MAFKKAFRIQLRDHRSGELIQAAGGKVVVVQNGTAKKQTLYDMDGAALANPVSMTNGYFEFQVDGDTNKVDLYILAPGGQFVVMTDVLPAGPNEINIDTAVRAQAMVIPFSYADQAGDNTETSTGLTEPANAMLLPYPSIRVTDVDATETIDVGTLSTDSGDADGLISAASVAALGVVVDTNGALVATTVGTIPSVTFPSAHVSGSKAITYTLSAGADTAQGFVILPYVLTA